MARSMLKSTVEMASKLREGGIRTMATKSKSGQTAEKVKLVHRAPKRLTVGAGKTAGRNSSGRITSFHRGGGAKQLQRIVDLKRDTPSVGVIQRIDYDPNRSARLALVRWVDEVPSRHKRRGYTNEKPARPHMYVDPAATTTTGIFPLSSLLNQADERTVTCFSPKPSAARLMVGLAEASSSGSKNLVFTKANASQITCARDIFLSSFAPKAKGNRSSMSSPSFSLPRIAVAGAKPSFSATKLRDEAGGKDSNFEVRKWNLDGNYWANRMKRKAAVSWHGLQRAQ